MHLDKLYIFGVYFIALGENGVVSFSLKTLLCRSLPVLDEYCTDLRKTKLITRRIVPVRKLFHVSLKLWIKNMKSCNPSTVVIFILLSFAITLNKWNVMRNMNLHYVTQLHTPALLPLQIMLLVS